MIRLATVCFSIVPKRALSVAERDALSALPSSSCRDRPPFRVRIESRPVLRSADFTSPSSPTPLALRWQDGRLRVGHRRFQAEIDPHARTARLFRSSPDGYAITAVLRAALLARLPIEGGVALHAAGLLIGASGVAFFGPSGAGKSTLAAAAPYPVLSDELVVLSKPSGFRLMPSGFWSSVAPDRPLSGGAPLCALVELAKTETFKLERLPAPTALRRLLAVATVPPAGELWARTLDLLREIVDSTPVYRMGWALPEPPWERLRKEMLAGAL